MCARVFLVNRLESYDGSNYLRFWHVLEISTNRIDIYWEKSLLLLDRNDYNNTTAVDHDHDELYINIVYETQMIVYIFL